MIANQCAVEITVNGRPVKVYNHEGKSFIEARDGTEYEIKIFNPYWNRVMAVASVDGLDVLDGKVADIRKNGYIINAYDTLVIKGFRHSMSNVGAFKFTKKEKSYAAGKGNGQNVGVIAVALFNEQVEITNTIFVSGCSYSNTADDPWKSKSFYCSTADSFDVGGLKSNTTDSSNTIRSFQAGTTWGEKKVDKVVTVDFKKQSDTPFQVSTIYYDFKEGLEEMGIKLIPEKRISYPNPFPGQFAEPPKGWV